MDDDEFTKLQVRLGNEIKSLRMKAGLSQEALALSAEVDRTYVSPLERGVANPSLLILHRIAEVLMKELQISFAESSRTR